MRGRRRKGRSALAQIARSAIRGHASNRSRPLVSLRSLGLRAIIATKLGWRQLMTRATLGLRLAALSLLLAAPALAQEKPLPIEVGLGDVSLNKLMFVIAAETGTYKKNGLDVTQFITPGAAAVVRRSGIDVPKEFVRNAPGDI